MQAELCSLMASPKRLMIMDFLSRQKESCVGDLAEALESSISSISQHLRLMRDKNMVLARKDGHTVFYRLKHPKLMTGCHAVREVLIDELKSRGEMAQTLAQSDHNES